MPTRTATAVWNGSLKDGAGRLSVESGTFEGAYSFASRFENGSGTNPEELIGAAEAGCFSMAFSLELTERGYDPKSIQTTAAVTISSRDGGFVITSIDLNTTAEVSGIDRDVFMQIAEGARKNCPVSRALAGTEILLSATLK